MKFSDFPKEHVIINVYDALDELYLDYPLKVYPFFFDRLRSALEYLDISSEPIKGLNFDNQESYLSAIYDLMDVLCNKYESIIDDVRHNQELVLQYYKIDLLGLDIEYNDIEQIEIDN